MKTISEIHSDILNKFSELTGLGIQNGTVLDSISYAVSDAVYQAYLEIQSSKNPHLYSKLSGSELDDLGYLVNCARATDEEDDSYLHRLMEWLISSEAANQISIENALMNLPHVSYASYVPLVYGVGTAAIYIIPTNYAESDIAIDEVKEAISKVRSGDSFIDYIVPVQKQISLAAHVQYEDDTNVDQVKANLVKKIRNYINGIAIGDKLEIGEINKIGVNEPGVSYFVVLQLYIDNEPTSELEFLQTVHNKFVFAENGGLNT